MSLFTHYPADPGDISARSDSILAHARGMTGFGGLFGGRTNVAASQVDGQLELPVLGVKAPVQSDSSQVAVRSAATGGALGLFAGAVKTYNEGVDELNRIYERAKANDFGVEPVADDATGSDGEKLSDGERKDLHSSRISAARSALEAELRQREAVLMGNLDKAATGTASVLDNAADPTSVVTDLVTRIFGWGGGGSDGGDDGDDGGSSLLNDIGGAFSGGLDHLTDFGGTSMSLFGDIGEEIWDRGSTLGVYAWDTTVRRVTNPGQAMRDAMSGTSLVEDVSAFEGIVFEDGELDRDGPYCGDDAACLTGVSVPDGADAITTGHTIRVSDEGDVPDDLVAHEMQHVYDIEDVGADQFYTSYLGQYVGRRIAGDSHDEAYRNIWWEQRAYDVGDNYPDKKPQGIIDEVLDKIF